MTRMKELVTQMKALSKQADELPWGSEEQIEKELESTKLEVEFYELNLKFAHDRIESMRKFFGTRLDQWARDHIKSYKEDIPLREDLLARAKKNVIRLVHELESKKSEPKQLHFAF